MIIGVTTPIRHAPSPLHRGRMFHGSGPRGSDDRHIGVAIRHVTPGVKQLAADRDCAMLSRRADPSRNWINVAPPSVAFDPDAMALCDRIVEGQSTVLTAGPRKPPASMPARSKGPEPMTETAKTVSFTQMKDGTREEYLMLREIEAQFVRMTPDRILKALRGQAEETIEGYRIDRLTHGLQAATRAWRDGADIDWVVGALLHDIGDGLAPQNHDEFAAAIIRPYMREEVVWSVQHHAAFQMVYYAHHYGWNRFERENFRDAPYYQSCVDFCEHWDQASFDPDYETLPLEFFEPMLRAVFARAPYKPETTQPGVRKPLRNPKAAAERAGK